jgi:hypothetical protein
MSYINVAPNNARKWQMGFNSTFKGLINKHTLTMQATPDNNLKIIET